MGSLNTGFSFLVLLALAKLPSSKGIHNISLFIKMYPPFVTDQQMFMTLTVKTFYSSVLRFLENSFSSEYNATLQQMYQGDVEV